MCDVSGEHQPIAKFDSQTPFNLFSVGDRFDDHGWDRLDDIEKVATAVDPKMYVIHSIKHSVFSEKDDLIIQCWLNLSPYKGDPSPVWK